MVKQEKQAAANNPCEDEGRLNDPDLRENFIERVFTLWRFPRPSDLDDPGFRFSLLGGR